MKKFAAMLPIIFFTLIYFSCSSQPVWEGVFDYYPENPKAGDEITVFYNSNSTKLSSFDKIEMNAYLYSKKLDDAVGVEMKKVQSGWEGKIKTTKDTRGIIIKFKNDDNVDNNSNKGFVIHLTDGDKILAGSVAGLGVAVLNWGSYYLELERDFDLSLEYMQNDFKNNPGIKEEYLNSYLLAYSEVHPELLDSVVNAELTQLEKKKDFTEDDLTTLMEWNERTGKLDKADKYKKLLSEKFPSSEQMQFAKYQEIQSETDIVRMTELAEKFYTDFPESKYSQSIFDLVAIHYRDNKLYNEALEFFKANKNKTSIFRFYSVTQRMYKENADLPTGQAGPKIALEIAKLGVERGEAELKTPSKKKPEYLTEKEYKEETEYYAGLNYFSLGKALYLTGNKKEAEGNLEKAVTLTQKEEGEVNELYVNTVFENGDKAKAKKVIEDFIKDGKNTTPMIDVLKEVYISEKGSEDGFDNYLSTFKSFALNSIKEKLKTEMINEPAPDFTLTDLNGNKITLSELRGKTIVIDFWATWCGPCISSFPGMKKAVEKYSGDDNVKFLFVNSWERVEDKKTSAGSFIKKNNYPFQVLMDYDDKVVGDYGVSGIPTKFIIDKSGNIRFKSIGFMGNVDQLVDEITVMVSLLN